MVLDFSSLDKHSSVKCFLCMGSSHVGAFPPLILDRVPGLLGHPCHYHTQTRDVRAVKGNVASCELVLEGPFIKCRGAQIDGGVSG